MIATHRVRTADKNTVGFMIDGVFYTNDYIRQNIAYIANMSLQENGVPEAEMAIYLIQSRSMRLDAGLRMIVNLSERLSQCWFC